MADFAFLHGGGQGSWVWAETIAAMRSQSAQGGGRFGRALALDVPGCGAKRGRATEAVEVPEIVAELIGDITAAELADIVLVGHSQAGSILPLLVAARPGLFRQVVYVTCSAPAATQTVVNFHLDMPEAGSVLKLGLGGDMRERYRAMFCNDMGEAQAAAFLDRLGCDAWPASSYRMTGWDYAHLGDLPGSYVICLRDATLVPPWQEIFAERLGVRRTIRLDAGHQAMNTRPQALAEILLDLAEAG